MLIVAVAVLVLALAAVFAILSLQAGQQERSDFLSSYGGVTNLTYQGTTLSLIFTSNTSISLYSAAISYTANNHANSEQSYQTTQMPLGTRPVYTLARGGTLTMKFSNIPAGSLLLNIDVQVNATVGSHHMLLTYEIPRLENNSSQ